MKKTKIKRRIENAFNAFFADENSDENKLKIYGNENNLWYERKFEDSAQKNGTLEAILKQTLLFFPGTFILYFLGIGFPLILGEVFTARLRADVFFALFFLICLLLAGTLMTWLGLGNIRKPKHFVIPASILSVGGLWIAIIGVLSIVSGYFGNRILFKSDYLIYFFPLALIVPFLVKGWVDRDS